MKIKLLSLGCLVLVVLLVAGPHQVSATLVSFQEGVDGYAGTEDTSLESGSNANNNYGNRDNLNIGVQVNGATQLLRRALIRFDTTSLVTDFPGGFTVNSATLRLTTTGAQTLNQTIDVHLFDDANVGWVEGVTNGAAAVGESTWNRRNHDSPLSAAIKWAGDTPGAGVAGTDYDTTPLASTLVGTTVLNGDIDFALTGDLSFINTWANGGTNAGFFLKYAVESGFTSNSVFNFRASEKTGAANISRRPELILDVTAVPEPSSAALLGIVSAGLALVGRRRKR